MCNTHNYRSSHEFQRQWGRTQKKLQGEEEGIEWCKYSVLIYEILKKLLNFSEHKIHIAGSTTQCITEDGTNNCAFFPNTNSTKARSHWCWTKLAPLHVYSRTKTGLPPLNQGGFGKLLKTAILKKDLICFLWWGRRCTEYRRVVDLSRIWWKF